MRFLDRVLRDDAGLYRDHIGADGAIEPTVWSYNQGTPIGASVLLSRITGDDTWIERATQTAVSSAAALRSRRRLVAAATGVQRDLLPQSSGLARGRTEFALLDVLDDYLERVWTHARHRRTGLFVDGGIGSYDGNPTIDQAGLTQVFAFRAWGPDRWPDIC